MTRLHWALAAFCLMYGVLLALFAVCSRDVSTDVIRAVWATCGSIALAICAMELTLLAYWFWTRSLGLFNPEPYVKLDLSTADRRLLERIWKDTAVLIPAHKEATDEADARALATRVVGILCNTPRWAHVYLLFDSPADQIENERGVVREVLQLLWRAGRGDEISRLFCKQYRKKEKKLRNKPGSIVLWLAEHAQHYRYMFVLDADSAFPTSPIRGPRERHIIERLVVAMLRHGELSMIQTALRIPHFKSLFGWYQSSNADKAARYQGIVFQTLLEGEAQSYGHSCLFDINDFVKHVKNTLEFLSHDFLDAADLIAAGCQCIHTQQAVTYENAEDGLVGFCVREHRWSRGNSQWCHYLLKKRGLPWGPKVFLSLGILSYVWPLVGTVMFGCAVVMGEHDIVLVNPERPLAAWTLLGAVIVSCLVPHALGSKSALEFVGSALIGLVMTPSLMLIRGFVFLVAAFGTTWSPRGVRSLTMNFEHCTKIFGWFYPAVLLGLMAQQQLLAEAAAPGLGRALVQFHASLLIISPLAAIALSWPVFSSPEPAETSPGGSLQPR